MNGTRRIDDVGPYSHNGDDRLFKKLGLKTKGWKKHEWNDLGVVTVHEEDDERTPTIPASEVRVEVYACPAQFFRFTILRPQDESIPTPRERIVISTGSGGFRDYWPTAELLAQHRLKPDFVGYEGEEEKPS